MARQQPRRIAIYYQGFTICPTTRLDTNPDLWIEPSLVSLRCRSQEPFLAKWPKLRKGVVAGSTGRTRSPPALLRMEPSLTEHPSQGLHLRGRAIVSHRYLAVRFCGFKSEPQVGARAILVCFMSVLFFIPGSSGVEFVLHFFLERGWSSSA